MSNKCTLLIDGNWLLMSRVAVLMKEFEKDNSEIILEEAQKDLKELLAKSINIILNRFPIIDNIIMISDGGSWRKQLPIPKSLKDITYKGNRVSEVEHDWNKIFECLTCLSNKCKELGITTCNHSMIEGDDWIWYWSKKLNSSGTNCIIWSADNDLKQLVQLDKSNNCFTVWYNDNYGLWLPEDFNIPKMNDIEFFMNPIYTSSVLEHIKTRAKKSINFINPNSIINSKIICGDNSDNIMAVARFEKNNRNYKISEKDWGKIRDEIGVNTIQEFLDKKDIICKCIINSKKFSPYKLKIKDVLEMIDYNTKLVWLNEKIIPETIISFMNTIEYNVYDISYLRSNYKTLCPNDEDIENIFDSINF